MAEQHPELVVTFMKGMIKVGRWANEHKHAAATILDKQTFYLDVEDTYRGIKDIDIVPNLSPQNLVSGSQEEGRQITRTPPGTAPGGFISGRSTRLEVMFTCAISCLSSHSFRF